MKNNHLVILLNIALTVLLLNNAIAANQERTEADAISMASEPVYKDPEMLVDNLINQYLNQGKGKKIREKISTEGGWIGYATAEVAVAPENPNWAKYRVLAYEKALTDIEIQYIETQHQSVKAKKIKKFFKNVSDSIPDYETKDMSDPNKVELLFEKLMAVAEGKLDNTLDELGVDKEQFKRTPKKQRHILLSEGLSKTTMTEAIGSLTGLIPIQTFEGFNSEKQHVIGVIAIATPKMKQFAYDIVHSRGQLTSTNKTGKNLYELFSKNNSLLIDQFGVRKMKDENGFPSLIAFGQWANSKKTDNKRLLRRYRKAAKKQAEAIAKNQIAMFLAGNTIFQSNSELGEIFEEAYNVHHDNYKEQDMIDSILDGIRENSKSRAKISISGLTRLYSWTSNHPKYGHEIVGVIMKWSPQNELQARTLRDWKPVRKNARHDASGKQHPSLKGLSGSKMGQEYMELDDF